MAILSLNYTLVSIIILNWNEGSYITRCLDHIIEQTYPNIETIIIDQGSTDGSIETIEKYYPQFRIIRNRNNVGFGKGMNQGINASNGQYILCLNADVFLHPKFVQNAVEVFEQEKVRRIGMIAGKVYRFINGEYTREIQSLGLFLLKRMSVISNINGEEKKFVFGPAGCCPIIRREMLEDVRLPNGDYYDSMHFVFAEDLDLWFRAQLRGWLCLFVPTVIAWHIHGGSTKGRVRFYERPGWLQAHWLKNRYMVLIKNVPSPLMLNILLPFILVEISLWLYIIIFHPGCFRNLLYGFKLFLTLLPKAIELRHYIQAGINVSSAKIHSLFIGV